jgi:YD repeat-containing protein
MKITIRILIACLVLICGLGSDLFAQSGSCKHYATGIEKNLDGTWPPGYSDANCTWEPSLSYSCAFYTCPSPYDRTETRGSCPSCSSPISLSSANTTIEENDVRIPGLAGGLTLTRTWNSIWPFTQIAYQTGLFGPNWRSTYEERIFMGSDNLVRYARSDGSFWSFGGSGPLYPVAPGNVTAALTTDSPTTQWTLAFQSGEKRIFSYTTGSLTAIVDRNGNTTQISYDALNRLVSVTDPGGRHLYFGYANSSSWLITSVSSDVGISLGYAYDSSGRLVQVTEPDLTTLSYSYDANSMITTVTDSNGKVLEAHTYDVCGQGWTGSRAGGVESVSLNQPSCVLTPVFQYGSQ